MKQPIESKRLLNKEVSFLDVLSLFLSVYVLMQLLVEVLFSLSAETKIILGYADYFVSAVFLLDFLVRFKAAPSKLSFMKLGWIDLLSAVPVNNWIMLGRFTRVGRLVRVIRALRSTEELLRILLRHRLQNTLLVLTMISVLLVVTCGSAMLTLEKDQKDANIATVGDALWWATTMVYWITPSVTDIPADPIWLATVVEDGKVVLRWQPSIDPSFYSYELYLMQDTEPGPQLSPEPLRAALWVDTAPEAGPRTYGVRSVSASGVKSALAVSSSVRI